MEVSGEAADLMVKEGIQLTEEAIKLLASGSKNMIALLWALSKDDKKLMGKTNMKRLLRDGRPLATIQIKESDFKDFARYAKHYGILFSAVKKKDGNGLISVISNVDYLPQTNYVLQQMGYPIPGKEEPTAKKAVSRAPQENDSKERGNGSTVSRTMADPEAEKPSVRKKLEDLKAAAKGGRTAPERAKDHLR